MYVKRGYKCWGFSHDAKSCSVGEICPNCGEKHSANCNKSESRCRNCCEAMDKYDTVLDVNYKMSDKEYTCYQKIYNRLKSRINYSEVNFCYRGSC